MGALYILHHLGLTYSSGRWGKGPRALTAFTIALHTLWLLCYTLHGDGINLFHSFLVDMGFCEVCRVGWCVCL
jgi:hypothetical protein